MDLRGMISVVRARLWLITAGVVVAALAALAVSVALPKVYESRATLIVGQSLTAVNPDVSQLLASQQLSQTYAQVATTRPNLEAVIEVLGLDVTPEELREQVTVSAPMDSTLLFVTVQDGDPLQAAGIANAIAAQLIVASPTVQGLQTGVQQFVDVQLRAVQADIEQVQADIDRLVAVADRTPEQDQQLQALETRLMTLRTSYAQLLSFSSGSTANSSGSTANLLTVVEPAVPATGPSSPRIPVNVLLAVIAGLIVSAGLAFLIDHLDDTVKTAEDAEQVTGLPVLGSIVQIQGTGGRNRIDALVARLRPRRTAVYSPATLVNPRSQASEAFRKLRANVEFTSIDPPTRSLLITSPASGEGKTTLASNLAVAFAQAGYRTLLVDADLRGPALHLVFDLPNSVGLTDMLRSDDVSIAVATLPTQEPNLRLMPSGPLPPNPAELLGSERMRVVLGRLLATAELVILDCAPLFVADAAVLAAGVDASLLVLDSGRTRRASAQQGRDALSRVGARVIGVALNRIPRARADSLRYYGYPSEGSPGSPRASVTRAGSDATTASAPDSSR